MNKQVAFTSLTIKAVDTAKRMIRGIATSPSPDRVNDVVEPLGVQFRNPAPLLMNHRHDQPVGTVTFGKPTAKGVPFEATFPDVAEPSQLRARIEEAFQSCVSGIIRHVSIGFRPLEYSVIEETGGLRFTKTDVYELSLTAIPAQPDASFEVVKEFDREIRAAIGKKADEPGKQPSGVSEKKTQVKLETKEKKMSLSEKLKGFQDELKAKKLKLTELAEKSVEGGETFDEADQEQFDTLKSEVEALEKHVERVEYAMTKSLEKAVPVDEKAGKSEKAADEARGKAFTPARVKSSNVKKGARFARYAMAMAAGRGSIADAVTFSEKNWGSSTPEVTEFIKAVAGNTTSATWAAPLVDQANIVGEFVELLRPETLLGKMTGFRNVPFNIKIPVQTGGSTIGWVGEGAVKPVGELAFDTITLGHNKVAGIVVLTDELARFSNPDAEATVQRDLIEQSAQFLDDAFINPANTATPGVSPAAVTVGATSISASGTDFDAFLCDLAALQETFLQSNLSPAGAYLVMSSVQAARLAMFRSVMGQYEFPNLSANGGSLAGYTVVTSENIPRDSAGESIIALIKPSEILLADDGNVTLDASREATLDMAGGATPNFSLWQRNCVGIRAERYITWAKRRASAVAYISDANYTTCSSS